MGILMFKEIIKRWLEKIVSFGYLNWLIFVGEFIDIYWRRFVLIFVIFK